MIEYFRGRLFVEAGKIGRGILKNMLGNFPLNEIEPLKLTFHNYLGYFKFALNLYIN